MNEPNNPYAAPLAAPLDLPLTPGSRIPATFGERFLAALIDGVILWVVSSVIGRVARSGLGLVSVRGISSILIGWLYNALQEASTRQGTIGKVAMGIRVTDMDGQPVSFARATGRHFSKYISMIILFIGYFMMLWDQNRQTLHDKISGCLLSSAKRSV